MARLPFPVTVTIDGTTKTISSAPKWARHRMRALIELNDSTTFDSQSTRQLNKSFYREFRELVYRYGV